MQPKFFFMRHGRVGKPDQISEEGCDELVRMWHQLRDRGFKPKEVYSSTALRCQQTAAAIAPTATLRLDTRLHVFPYPEMAERLIAGPLGGLIECFVDYAEEDTLVVSHDCLPTFLALALARRCGREIDWRTLPEEQQCLSTQGAGFLVDGSELIYLAP